ncbi:MAG: ADP-ribosylglycohydrolase family protein [Phototrophicaceae bacterium]
MSLEQSQALLFGLALGDALGWPTEFLSQSAIRDQYGEQGIQAPPHPALYTDDTQMTLALTEGLLQAGLAADLDHQMVEIAEQFVHWKDTAPSRAPGLTCLRGVENYESSGSWRTSGVASSKGCGSAMRVATLGYCYQHDPERLRIIARASSQITHAHPAALDAAVAAAYLVKLALDGVHPKEYLRELMAFLGDCSEDMSRVLYRVGQAHMADEVYAMRHIGQGWTGDEAVGLALWIVQKFPDDYVKVVQRGANYEGDSDSIASIAGGISAARLGLAAIPTDWQARCENRDLLLDLSQRMALARATYLEAQP